MSLGASRGRVLRQLFWESVLLASGGALAGVALATVLSRALVAFIRSQAAFVDLDVALDWRVLGFVVMTALCICLGLALCIGLFLARSVQRASLTPSTRDGQGHRRALALQRPLVVAQVAVAIVLVVSSLLFVRSFRNMLTFDVGFRQQGIAAHYVDLGDTEPDRTRRRLDEVLEALKSTPGIEAASVSTHVPMSNSSFYLEIRTPDGREGGSQFTWVSPEYFTSMEVPLLEGRRFTDRDDEAATRVMIVNGAFVRRYFGGVSPVGRTVRSLAEPGYEESEYAVVGVAGDTRYLSLREVPPPIAYVPEAQRPSERPSPKIITSSPLPVAQTNAAVQAALNTLGPDARVTESVDLRARIVEGMSRERMLAWIAGFFGVLASGLAALGLYGVVSFFVETRRAEIGVRMALGATAASVIRMVLRRISGLALIGLSLGILLTSFLSSTARALLFGLEPHDPVTLVAAVVVVVGISLGAALLPARRAATVEPRTVLGS